MKATPQNIAARVTERLFEARKGHGGADVSYLQMRLRDLQETIEAAIQLYVDTNKKGRKDDPREPDKHDLPPRIVEAARMVAEIKASNAPASEVLRPQPDDKCPTCGDKPGPGCVCVGCPYPFDWEG